jgi:hypothetical protein
MSIRPTASVANHNPRICPPDGLLVDQLHRRMGLRLSCPRKSAQPFPRVPRAKNATEAPPPSDIPSLFSQRCCLGTQPQIKNPPEDRNPSAQTAAPSWPPPSASGWAPIRRLGWAPASRPAPAAVPASWGPRPRRVRGGRPLCRMLGRWRLGAVCGGIQAPRGSGGGRSTWSVVAGCKLLDSGDATDGSEVDGLLVRVIEIGCGHWLDPEHALRWIQVAGASCPAF